MSEISVLSPPLAFAIVLAASVGFAAALRPLALRRKGPARGLQPYACGEDLDAPMIQPDYGQFIPFAFFFTILHVVALTVTTLPVRTMTSSLIAVVYILGALVGLTVLYRK